MIRDVIINPAHMLNGELYIPGDKSISHRAVMLASLADRPVYIHNFLYAADCCATISCMQSLGVEITRTEHNSVVVKGNGLFGLKEPKNILDAGNSGTTIRLLTGILGTQPFLSIVTGDDSLRGRPMSRVIQPLKQMGCNIRGRDTDRYAPLAIMPVPVINSITYDLPVASAQVKSAILLAGLFADNCTRVTEPFRSRDHTELMLESFGVRIERDKNTSILYPPAEIVPPLSLEVPGDISSAAFWLVAATIIPDSSLRLINVGVNPSRTGIIDVLLAMGADIHLTNQRLSGKEPVADILVKHAPLKGITLEADIIPRLIDEIPILAVAALAAQGITKINGASELRVKETDRLAAVAGEFSKMGANIREQSDGLVIEGPQRLAYASCESHHDHRIAMMLAIAGASAQGVKITNPECVRISYPNFFEELNRIASCVEEIQ